MEDIFTNSDIMKEFDAIEKKIGLVNSSSVRNPESTGLLVLDLIMGGGLTPGSWVTFFGGEQSAKTTLACTVLLKNVGNVTREILFDYEGSFDENYFSLLGRSLGCKLTVPEIFGVKDQANQWTVVPRIRYYSSQIGEEFFDFLFKLQMMLPDKLQLGDSWYYVFDKEHKAKYQSLMDKRLYSETGRVWVPCPDGKMQALIVLDSYPAMLPRNMDEEDKTQGMANQARMFSDQLKRVKGRMRQKKITVMGVNQLRLKPGTMYGSPWYEPGGEALKFFSDVRIEMTGRAVLGGKGQIEEEESVTGGKDVYRYVHLKAKKNKLSTPYLEGWARLWISDEEGNARGFDPVFDTFTFLKETGSISGTKNRIKINLPQMLDGQHKPLNWLGFKKLVNGDSSMIRDTLNSIGVERPFYLRRLCFSMFNKGTALPAYFSTMLKKGPKDMPEE